jgi:hypothetical protein
MHPPASRLRSKNSALYVSRWFQELMLNGLLGSELTFYSYEAWFILLWHTDSQKIRYWSKENHSDHYEVPLYDLGSVVQLVRRG